MNRHILSASLVGVTLLLPTLAFAAGLNDAQLSSVSKLLRSYGVDASSISQVEGILRTATTTPGQQGKPEGAPGQAAKQACIELSRNLALGSRGEDVRKVQELLAADPNSGFVVAPTGYYGPATARAMARWQELKGIATSSSGAIGPLTRGFFERACGNLKLEGPANEGAVMGTIGTLSSSSFTITTPGNAVVTVTLTASTTYKVLSATDTAREGTVADLAIGKVVSVTGTKNTDGSITAHKVTINVELPTESRPGGGVENRQRGVMNEHRPD